MSNDPLQQFHKLVREERYREARGVLETADDLDPRTVEKWTKWLYDLHAEEWEMVGAMSDKAKLVRNPHQAKIDYTKMLFSTLAVTSVGFLIALVSYEAFTTPSLTLGSFFLLVAMVSGVVGWYRVLHHLSNAMGIMFGGGIGVILTIYLMSSGIPLIYYPEGPPVSYLFASIALLYPVFGNLSWRFGERVGQWIGELLFGKLEPDDDDDGMKKRQKRLSSEF